MNSLGEYAACARPLAHQNAWVTDTLASTKQMAKLHLLAVKSNPGRVESAPSRPHALSCKSKQQVFILKQVLAISAAQNQALSW